MLSRNWSFSSSPKNDLKPFRRKKEKEKLFQPFLTSIKIELASASIQERETGRERKNREEEEEEIDRIERVEDG